MIRFRTRDERMFEALAHRVYQVVSFSSTMTRRRIIQRPEAHPFLHRIGQKGDRP